VKAGGALISTSESPTDPELDLGPSRTYAARSHASGDATDEPGPSPTGVPESVAPPRAGPAPVGRIGRYLVDRVLGSGAFGTVYLARDEELERPVAIKVPRPDRIAREEDIEAYLAEARVLASLDHPGIVPVYDIGRTEDGRCYVVSKLVPGQDLSRRLRQARPSLVEAVAIVIQAAEAMAHAHRRGLVHRDLKPGNLLMDGDGTVYVADFGLALNRERTDEPSLIAGTPAYMSPEQARGAAALDGRSDVFSLGAVLYELMTGVKPFAATTVPETLERVALLAPPPPSALDPLIPDELSRICLHCLEKDPRQRFGGAGELATGLRRWQKSWVEAGRGPLAERLVPERGRPFGARDAELYLDLMPGERGVDGLPIFLRRWKDRVEETDADRTFRVALLAGAPGSGKSSLIRAGLLPRLSNAVRPILITAARGSLEGPLRAAAAEAGLGRPAGAPPEEFFAELAHGPARPPSCKTLVVIDQLERWLVDRGQSPEAGALGRALRQCDGRRLQCILVVRDDFREPARRLLRDADALAGAVDWKVEPMTVAHAYKVLVRIGQAFRCLPEDEVAINTEQRMMLATLVGELADGGAVCPLRLAQFAALIRELPWTPATISQLGTVGGIVGGFVGVLERAIDDPSADSTRVQLARAARAVVAATLPLPGRKGPSRSTRTKDRSFASSSRPDSGESAELMRILDDELRLISPIPPRQLVGPPTSSYRMADNLLAPSVQLWLKRAPGKARRPAPRSVRHTTAARRVARSPTLDRSDQVSTRLLGWLVTLGVIALPFVLPALMSSATGDSTLSIVRTLAWLIFLVAAVVIGVIVVTRGSRLLSRWIIPDSPYDPDD
jgi:hypothetical protein